MKADDFIFWISVVVIGGFILMGLYGTYIGSKHAFFDLLGIAAGVTSLVWVARHA